MELSFEVQTQELQRLSPPAAIPWPLRAALSRL